MGQTISKARGSLITRTVQRFNIEARTDKYLEKDKPTSAPRFKSDTELIDSIRQDRPDLGEYIILQTMNMCKVKSFHFSRGCHQKRQ